MFYGFRGDGVTLMSVVDLVRLATQKKVATLKDQVLNLAMPQKT